MHKIKPGPFATLLHRRSVLLLASASLYGVSVLPDIPAAASVFTTYGHMLNWLQNRLNDLWGVLPAAWVLSISIGDHTELDPHVVQSLAALGVVHALIASGATVLMTIVPIVQRLQSRPFARLVYWFFPALCLLGCMSFVTGFSLPAMRTILVYGYKWTADACGRRGDRLTGNAVSVALLTLWQADVGIDPGVLLSYSAATVLYLLTPEIARRLPRCMPTRMREWLARGMAAELGITPLIALLFQQLSLLSLVVNIVLYPLLEAAIPFSIFCLVIAIVVPSLAIMLRPLLSLGCTWMNQGVTVLQKEPLVLHITQLKISDILLYFSLLWLTIALLNRFSVRMNRQYL